jgi:predicted alpha/beta hydrolase
MQKLTITTADGYQLSALYSTAVGKTIGTIILSSATGIKKEFYLNFTKFLVQNGYNVLLNEYRDIGKPAPGNLKKSTGFMHWGIKEMDVALDYLVNEKGVTGIMWIRHSTGPQLTDFPYNGKYIQKVLSINAALGYWALSTHLAPVYFQAAFINMPSSLVPKKIVLSKVAISVLE